MPSGRNRKMGSCKFAASAADDHDPDPHEIQVGAGLLRDGQAMAGNEIKQGDGESASSRTNRIDRATNDAGRRDSAEKTIASRPAPARAAASAPAAQPTKTADSFWTAAAANEQQRFQAAPDKRRDPENPTDEKSFN